MSQSAPAAQRRRPIAETSVPKLSRGTRLRFDQNRERWVLLVPERVLVPDPIAVEVLELCDGVRDVSTVVDLLAERYAAPREQISADVIEMLQDLVNSGYVSQRREEDQ